MTAFAGIIRHDRIPVSEGWFSVFAERPLARLFKPVADTSVVFAAWPRWIGEPPSDATCFGPGGRVLLLDARIDNREELCDALQLDDASLNGATDGDLVSWAYAQWGDDAAARLIGEFAFAVWDPRHRRLFMARDILGARAVYYSASATHFVFATELRVLLALPCVPRTLRKESVVDYLVGDGSGPPDVTFYEAVRVLPSAHALVLEGGRYKQTPYWTPKECRTVARAGVDYARELRLRMTEAVECRLRGGKRVAVHLSGGLDSSSVACLAARSLKREGRRLLALCSLLPPDHQGPESDERTHIEAVLAQEENIDPVWVRTPVGREPCGVLTRWFDTLGQPSYSNVTHIEEQLGEVGRAHGVDVVLSGFGGDLFVSVQGRYAMRELLLASRWGEAVSTLRALHREQGTGWSRLLWGEILIPLVPQGLRQGLQSRAPVHCANNDLLRHLGRQRERTGRATTAPWGSLSPRACMRFLLAPGRIERLLCAYTQVFAREFAQELRFPLLDSRVIELMLDTPVVELQLGGWPRSLMRRAMANILPESVRLRRDKGGAFDPAITSRFVAARAGMVRWAEETGDRNCWRYVDRARFLEALQAVEAAPREHWRQDFFRIVIAGGIVAHFIEWHERKDEPA